MAKKDLLWDDENVLKLITVMAVQLINIIELYHENVVNFISTEIYLSKVVFKRIYFLK